MFCDSYMFDTFFKVLGISFFSEEDWSDEVQQIAPSLLRNSKNSTPRDPTHSCPACSHLHTSDHLILIHIPTWWAQRWTLTPWCRIKSTRIIHRRTIHIYRPKTVFTDSIQIQHISTLFRTMTVQKCKWPRDLAIQWMLYQHLLQNRLFPTQWCQKKRMVNLSLWSQQKAATQRWVMWMSAWGYSTNYLHRENYQMTPPQMTSQSGFYNTETRSPPFNQINPGQHNTHGQYDKSPPLSVQNKPLTIGGHANYENISPPSATALRNSSAESFQTPDSWHHQPGHKDYRLTHNNYQQNVATQQTPSYHQQNAEFTPLPSPETSPPCEYQARPATGRVVPSNVTVNFNNFGNSHIGIDAPLEFPLSFDFHDITQQNQCVQQQSFVNYAWN